MEAALELRRLRLRRSRGGPTPTQVINRSFSTVGEFGYGIDTSAAGVQTFKFWDSSTTPPFQFAPVLDFFSYNPVSSAYPRAASSISIQGTLP